MKDNSILSDIANIRLEIIINKDLYEDRYIEYDEYKVVEDNLMNKLKNMESMVN